MSTIRSNKKKVSFLEKGERKVNVTRSNIKKGSILKSKSKKQEEEKAIEKKERNDPNKIEIKREEPIDNKNSIKRIPTDEYFKLTVQNVLQEGLLNIAMLQPKDPIRFLGNYLIEKSKLTSAI